jgi:hypothetical protein
MLPHLAEALADNGGVIPVTIIGTGEKSQEFLFVSPLETLHHELMGSHCKREVVLVVPLFCYSGAERKTGTSRRNAPSYPVVRVRPFEI